MTLGIAATPDLPSPPRTTEKVLAWTAALYRALVRSYRDINSMLQYVVGRDVASAAAIEATGNIFHVTGTTGITSVNPARYNPVTMIFDAALTVTDGSNLKLAGNFVTTAGDTLTIAYDGVNWHELHRSVN